MQSLRRTEIQLTVTGLQNIYLLKEETLFHLKVKRNRVEFVQFSKSWSGTTSSSWWLMLASFSKLKITIAQQQIALSQLLMLEAFPSVKKGRLLTSLHTCKWTTLVWMTFRHLPVEISANLNFHNGATHSHTVSCAGPCFLYRQYYPFWQNIQSRNESRLQLENNLRMYWIRVISGRGDALFSPMLSCWWWNKHLSEDPQGRLSSVAWQASQLLL